MEKVREGFVLDEKPVFDWNRVPVGTVIDTRRDARTHAAVGLVVNLTPEAQQNIGGGEELLTIPISHVFAIRKDSVLLDRSLHELRRADVLAPAR